MNISEKSKILSSIEADEFIGRNDELDLLLRHAKGLNERNGMVVLSAPGLGLSEMLRQVYDQLFYEQGEVIPFYFRIDKRDRTAKQMAIRFLQSFLRQTVSFRRNDAAILRSSADICELGELSMPSDGYWIDRLVETCSSVSELNDDNSFIRQALSAPLRAASHSAASVVIIDDFDNAEFLTNGIDLVEEFKNIYRLADFPFIFAGKRRFLFNSIQTGRTRLSDVDRLDFGPLSFSESGILIESYSNDRNVKVTDQTRDLIAEQFRGNPSFIKMIINRAAESSVALDSFQNVENVYTEELFGGKVKGFYDSIFDSITADIEIQKQLIGLLYNSLTVEREKTPVEFWKTHLALSSIEFYRVMGLLNSSEILRQTSNLVETMPENEILSDYIKARFRLEIRRDRRTLVVAESIAEFLKRAPETMAKFYRRKTAIGMRSLISVFNNQNAPISLFDYSVYKDRHKGENPEKILEKVNAEPEKIELPQIVYTANTVSFYSPIGKLTETERSAVALGFESAEYKDENEVVWIAAEIDSKLEAPADLVSFWCDRLEMVALMCDFRRFRLWLVAPEGFSPEALEVLDERNAIGSSKQQVRLLAKFLDAEDSIEKRFNPNEYELVLPMGDDTELIAASALEDVARRHSVKSKAINQIKTALVEACINATEHSHSPDQKIYQKFSVEDGRISITISNRGLRFKGKEATEIFPDEGRRGWGINLINSLMDEVKFENVDDGTRISMTKYISK
ncbi:MAG: hypothetical protein HKN25_12775 [Pyrinomonadaceae bacterium]|nr:hypothetical protein [Pyrinomonadaceae bacterium]